MLSGLQVESYHPRALAPLLHKEMLLEPSNTFSTLPLVRLLWQGVMLIRWPSRDSGYQVMGDAQEASRSQQRYTGS